MKSLNITEDVRALNMLNKQQRAVRDFQQPWNINFEQNDPELVFKNKNSDVQHDDFQHHSDRPKAETPSSPSFRGVDQSDSKNRAKIFEEQLRSSANMKEYQMMKAKFRREIAKQNQIIRGLVDQQNRGEIENEEDDLESKKNQILNRLNKLKYGATSKSMEKNSNPREASPIGALRNPLHVLHEPSSIPLLPNNRFAEHKSHKHLKHQATPEYSFNTKQLSEAVKHQEYEVRMKAFKSHDYMKDNKRLAKKVKDSSKKAFEVIEFEGKFEHHNTDSRNMIVEKVKNVDRFVELKAKRKKYIKATTAGKEGVEDDYISSIKMKMNLISKMVDLK